MATKENERCRKRGVAAFIKALENLSQRRSGKGLLDQTLQYMWGFSSFPPLLFETDIRYSP